MKFKSTEFINIKRVIIIKLLHSVIKSGDVLMGILLNYDITYI
jgi:hypothetical protein